MTLYLDQTTAMTIDTQIVFGAIGAAAVVGTWVSGYYGVKYSVNGMRERVKRIEDIVTPIPAQIAALNTKIDERTKPRPQ